MERESIEVVNTHFVFPNDTNNYGTIFGGKLVEMMDLTGALSAIRFSGEDVVTASIEAIDFKIPIKQSDIYELRSKVIYTAKTSMVVKIDVYREEKFCDKKDFCCRGYFIFVAIDNNGKPKSIPTLKPISEEDKKFWSVGEIIKRRAIERKTLTL
jgi:acyl-CoA hydrolase